NAYCHGDVAAYRALILLKDVDPDEYDGLDPEMWAKWAPVVVVVPKETGTESGEFDALIAADASDKAPTEFARTVQWLIRAERRRSPAQPPPQSPQPAPSAVISPFWILRTLRKCWGSKALKEMVFAELKNHTNSPAQFESLLEPLLEAEFAPARYFAASRLTARRLRTPNHRPFGFAAATQLAAHSLALCWPLIWKQVLNDRQFGADLFLKIAHE